MPPPGYPDWIFPGAVVIPRPPIRPGVNEGGRYAITSLVLSPDETRGLDVILQEIQQGDTPTSPPDYTLAPAFAGQPMDLRELLTRWAPADPYVGEYLFPRGGQEITTIRGPLVLGDVVTLTNSRGERGDYVVTEAGLGGDSTITFVGRTPV